MSSRMSVRPIAVGKLVSVSRQSSRCQPLPLEQALPARDREVPWLVVATTSGVLAWLIMLVMLAVNGVSAEPVRAAAPAVAAVAIDPMPIAVEPASDDEAQPERRPVFVLAALARRPAAELPEPLAPVATPPEAPAPAPAQPAGAVTEPPAKAVHFVRHPPDAFRQARQEGKLVLMIHLSGNFEDQEYT